ncbi:MULTISPECIES: HNH endonuclease family protein [unclassified Micromonospora]|uniref:HNH endonuclease family protein n=1 Tax=unclassified Micromonospora TaxID=2617518 RepID=UPI0005BE55AF|nr:MULTISPECIES: HNH endonuclease family protein [unclassified Micromonospora]MCK1805779.1 HNH endonuclease family protein [Micromonospora sp. R42106]MCK1830409.1 HNH endonuclease family protein [Micromonospora sp. R42003]MCK1843670.1 HNH endonuclease family protein [Micromonospora sp. R42004]MCM1017721.1 HNH endonuclease family protein [Micromonospora sp. XM-20-01]
MPITPVTLTPRAWRRAATITAAALAAAVLAVVNGQPASATPPGIPSRATAQSQLNALTVAAQGSMAGYSRDLFPHWITITGACNTREQVLKRDGTSVVVDSSCAATSGRWYSPYDGATWYAASDVDIDHVVPLAEAWRSGANSWTTSRRQSFANDLTRPQLIAVTDNVNQAKGDQDPSTWQPPLTSYRCTYSKMWITVKYNWGLTLQSSEKSALQSMLNTCAS